MKAYRNAIVILLMACTIIAMFMVLSVIIHRPAPEPEVRIVKEVVEVPRVIVRTVVEEAEAETITDEGEWTITAYCSCEKCCGKWYQGKDVPVIGSGGVELKEGTHCASGLKNGTKVIIEGVGLREVQDTPAKWVCEKYNNKIIDLYFSDHEAALKFGKKKANVKIIA